MAIFGGLLEKPDQDFTRVSGYNKSRNVPILNAILLETFRDYVLKYFENRLNYPYVPNEFLRR